MKKQRRNNQFIWYQDAAIQRRRSIQHARHLSSSIPSLVKSSSHLHLQRSPQRSYKTHHLSTDTHLPLVSIDWRFSPGLHTIVPTRAPRTTNPARPIRPLVNRSIQLSSRMHSNVIRTAILSIYITPRFPKTRMIWLNAQSVVELSCSDWWFVFWERGHFLP